MNKVTNIYEELGCKNADEMLAKSKIAFQIQRVMESRKLTQKETGQIIGINQSKVSNILRGKLSGFSIERLIRFLNALDCDVEIRIKPKAKSKSKARLHVHASL